MSKISCASIDCKYNKDTLCTAKVVHLSDSHIWTRYQGFKHIHECKTYKKSVEYENLEKVFQEILKGGDKD